MNRIKMHEYDDWYRNYNQKEQGIWVGNGIRDQYLISYDENSMKLDNSQGSNFGYAIYQGKATQIKLLGMKE